MLIITNNQNNDYFFSLEFLSELLKVKQRGKNSFKTL